jgi:hypothetical protein
MKKGVLVCAAGVATLARAKGAEAKAAPTYIHKLVERALNGLHRAAVTWRC